ncbi:MAG: hypothetical protein IKX92_07650, partial [Clostridia bacterium]|nr:hypothetical protein [Clostridia bacterium]
DKDRWVVASWSEKVAKQDFGNFEAVLSICAVYSPHIIADVTMTLNDMKVAVTSISTRENEGEIFITVGVKCSGVDHLKNIITGLSRIKNVREVTRGTV